LVDLVLCGSDDNGGGTPLGAWDDVTATIGVTGAGASAMRRRVTIIDMAM
jgi:hypothetical protein